MLDNFKDVRATVAAASGAADELDDRVRARYPAWENSQFFGRALQYSAGKRA